MDFWIFITQIGDEKTYIVLLPLVYFLLDRKVGWKTFLILIVSTLITVCLKYALKLPRPPSSEWRVSVEGYGFPSGHSATSTSFWGYLALKIKNKYFIATVIPLILLIAFSRIYLGVHYLQDIIGGIVIGLMLIYFFHKAEKITIKPSKKREIELICIVVSSFVISLLAPFIKSYVFKLAGILFGFGVAHIISTDFLGFRQPKEFKLRTSLALLSISILFTGFLLFEPSLISYSLTGFFACFFPNFLGNIIEKRIEKQRKY
jgi:undecaprenyl-diphosphatase